MSLSLATKYKSAALSIACAVAMGNATAGDFPISSMTVTGGKFAMGVFTTGSIPFSGTSSVDFVSGYFPAGWDVDVAHASVQPGAIGGFDFGGNFVNAYTAAAAIQTGVGGGGPVPSGSINDAIPGLANNFVSFDTSSLFANWNATDFNQGASAAATAPPASWSGDPANVTDAVFNATDGTVGETFHPVGRYDEATGTFSVIWASLIVGGPFNGQIGRWGMTGTMTVAPLAVDDGVGDPSFSSPSGTVTPATGDVITNDSASFARTIDATSITIMTDAVTGTCDANLDGTITYTPDVGPDRADTCTYTVADSTGQVSAPATVTFSVGDTGSPPEPVDDLRSLAEDSFIDLDTSITGLLSNDTDPDGDALTLISNTTPKDCTDPVAGTGTLIDMGGGILRYTPPADFNSTLIPSSCGGLTSNDVAFDYTVQDVNGLVGTATVTITVDPAEDDPVAVDDSAATTSGVSISIDPVLNDSDVDFNPGDETGLSVASFTQPTNGAVVEGSLIYTSTLGFTGVDTFTYVVQDAEGNLSPPATVTVTVAAAAVPSDSVFQVISGTFFMAGVSSSISEFVGGDPGTLTLESYNGGFSGASPLVDEDLVAGDFPFSGAPVDTYFAPTGVDGVSHPPPSIDFTTMTANWSSWYAFWNRTEFNQGATNIPVTLNADGTITLGWSSLIFGGPFDGQIGDWTLVLQAGSTAPLLAPAVTATQGGLATRTIARDGGPVTITAAPVGSGTFTFAWSGVDGLPSFPAGGLTLDPADIPAGISNLVVNVNLTKTGTDPLERGSGSISFTVIDGAVVVPDSNGNGVSDANEPAPDDARIAVDGVDPTMGSLEVETGKLVLGDIAICNDTQGVQVTFAQIEASGETNCGAVTNDITDPLVTSGIAGYYDFTVEGLPLGGTATIVIPLTDVIPANALWRKLLRVGSQLAWQPFELPGSSDTLASTDVISAGVCPAPGAAIWSDGLTAGHQCIRLTIVDGGPNDSDGVVNGVVRDPGTLGSVTEVGNIDLPSGGGGGCSLVVSASDPLKRADWFVLTLFLVGLGIWRRRSRLH